jgi:hypothetical protein
MLIYSFAVWLVGCSNSQKQTAASRDSTIQYPYSPSYSELEKGNPANSKIVLDVWRSFETGNVLSTEANFSDSIKLIFEDAILKGKKDAVLNQFQKRREAYAAIQTYVDSWMPVRATQANEDLVFVWARLDCTTKEGQRKFFVIHQIWWFDALGKIREMDQYITHTQ